MGANVQQPGTGWLDPNSPLFWRLFYVGAAAAYVGMFHLTLPGSVARIGGSGAAPHGHGLAMGAYFGSWIIIVNFAVDTFAYSFKHRTWASALHEAAH